MQDLLPIIPSCFYPSPAAGDEPADDPSTAAAAATKLGQSVVMSSYRTLLAGRTRLVTVTWCKTLLALGLYVSVDNNNVNVNYASIGGGSCKVEMRPWHFWRRHGTKRFDVDGSPVDVFWDLKSARFSDEPEPASGYYVAVVSDGEVALLLGDQKHDAFRRTGSRPSMVDAALVSKKEHVFGKRRFVTRAALDAERGKKLHEICIECSGGAAGTDCEMVIKVDGSVGVEVNHLQWKFRGHGSVCINDKVKVEVYWDVHDWLFGSSGLRHALFIFKPSSSSSSSSSCADVAEGSSASSSSSSSEFCLFLYAWKVE